MDLFEAASTAIMPAGRMAELPIATVEARPAVIPEAVQLGAGMQIAQLRDERDYKIADGLSRKAGIYHESPPTPTELPGGFIIYDDGRPVASLTYYYSEKDGKKSMELGNLAVDPESQRKGYGKVLLKEFLMKLDELGVNEFVLVANDAAASSYFQGYFRGKLGLEMSKLDLDDLTCREFIVKTGRTWNSGGKADG